MCFVVALSLTCSSSLIAALERPCAIRSSTWRSRSVSVLIRGAVLSFLLNITPALLVAYATTGRSGPAVLAALVGLVVVYALTEPVRARSSLSPSNSG
jgi:hypothetical protein